MERIIPNNPYEKIDAVLIYLNDEHKKIQKDWISLNVAFDDLESNPERLVNRGGLHFDLQTKYNIAINAADLWNILPYLEKEGLIEFKTKTPNVKGYKITFTGELFIEAGGFDGKQKREDSDKNKVVSEIKKQSRINLRNVILSGFAGAILGLLPAILQTFQTEKTKYLLLDSQKIKAVHDSVFLNIVVKQKDTSLIKIVKSK